MRYLAQTVNVGGNTIRGPLDPNINDLGDLVNISVSFLIPLAGIILLIMLIFGGYGYMTSRGDPEKVKKAKGKITSALIGFGLLLVSFLIVRIITSIFGIGTEIFQ